MQIYTILDQRLPDQNGDRWLKMYFKTGQSFWNRSRKEALQRSTFTTTKWRLNEDRCVN